MKKLLLITPIALAIGFITPMAMADDGTVTINGTIVASACSLVTGNDAITVQLPTATASSFSAAGQNAGKTAFRINLEDCTPTQGTTTYTNVTTSFSGGFDPAFPNILRNAAPPTPAPATNVGVRLFQANDTAIDINSSIVSTPIATGTMALDFMAAYESTAATVTAGPVQAIATFTIGYN